MELCQNCPMEEQLEGQGMGKGWELELEQEKKIGMGPTLLCRTEADLAYYFTEVAPLAS